MSNAFKNAANRQKKPAGGLPEELIAGMEKPQETSPVPEQETPEAKEEIRQDPAAEPDKTETAEPVQEAKVNGLVAIYEAKQQLEPEARTVRLQAVITPTLNEKLNKYVVERKIKSRNDLINFLLERYFQEVE